MSAQKQSVFGCHPSINSAIYGGGNAEESIGFSRDLCNNYQYTRVATLYIARKYPIFYFFGAMVARASDW